MLRVQLLQSNEFQSIGDIFEASPKLERGDALMSSTEFNDEFKRIQIEILSVVATQVKTIQDAIVNLSRPENRQENSNRHLGGRPKQGWVLCIHGRYYFTHPNLWLSLYDEPWLRQPNGIAGEPKDFFLLLRHDLSRFFRRANRTPVNRAFRSSKVFDNISVYWWPRARQYSLLNEIVTKHLINFNVTFVVNIMRKRTISFAIHKPIVRERTSYSLAVHA